MFSKPSAPLYKRKVFIYDRDNYQAFSNDLVQTDWQTLNSENINTYTENITERIASLANKHVPNRLLNARKNRPAMTIAVDMGRKATKTNKQKCT